MERFNVTTKGYKYDKLIFWGIFLILLIYIGTQFYNYGFKYHPYFKCISYECNNPFYTEEVKCTYVLGLLDCPVEKNDNWLNQRVLTTGEYGKKPLNNTSFLVILLGLFTLGFVLNHVWHNKGKEIHLNVFDKFKKIKLEEGFGNESGKDNGPNEDR